MIAYIALRIADALYLVSDKLMDASYILQDYSIRIWQKWSKK